MEQGVLRWSRKIETEQEPEFAILIVNAIIFLISQISPLHYFFILLLSWLNVYGEDFLPGNRHLVRKYHS